MSDLILETPGIECMIWYWTHQTIYVWFNIRHTRQCMSDL